MSSTGHGLGFVEVALDRLVRCFSLAVVSVFWSRSGAAFVATAAGLFCFCRTAVLHYLSPLNADHHHAVNWVAGLDSLHFSFLGFVPVCATVGFRVIDSRRGISRIDGLVTSKPNGEPVHLGSSMRSITM